MARAIGVDFGTTNSVVAVLNDDASVNVLRHGPALGDVFRTVLCFWAEEVRGRQLLHEAAGPAAIEAYLGDPLDSRLIMSMKTYLAQRSFTQTRVFGRIFTLERLVAAFLRGLLAEVGARAVNYTLDPKNKDSVTSKSIQKTIQRYTPSLVCKHWDYCAKGT